VSAPTNSQSEENLLPSEPEVAGERPLIGFEPLDELLAQSKIFADYVATLASEE
jgi:hypothetical protein